MLTALLAVLQQPMPFIQERVRAIAFERHRRTDLQALRTTAALADQAQDLFGPYAGLLLPTLKQVICTMRVPVGRSRINCSLSHITGGVRRLGHRAAGIQLHRVRRRQGAGGRQHPDASC